MTDSEEGFESAFDSGFDVGFDSGFDLGFDLGRMEYLSLTSSIGSAGMVGCPTRATPSSRSRILARPKEAARSVPYSDKFCENLRPNSFVVLGPATPLHRLQECASNLRSEFVRCASSGILQRCVLSRSAF